MVKLTKRKGFNFFRSYFDVYNELENDKDKIAFIDALLDRQFLGIKPEGLTGLAKFAYISQTNSIDSQVKGYEHKMGKILTPTQGGAVGGLTTPSRQVEEKGKEKGKQQQKESDVGKINNVFKNFLEEVKKGEHDSSVEQMYMTLKLKKGSLTPLVKEFNGSLIINNTIKKNTLEFRKHFFNWLNVQEKVGKLDEHKHRR